MSNKNHDLATGPTRQLRSSAENSSGSNAAMGFSSVNPVQKKDDPAQLNMDEKELDGALSLKPEAAQFNLDEKEEL